ncbi:MAG: lipoyl(octanoyl) transferase LipB [Vampirovibrionales bacterium]|nr:lipoyl(octanoyl) transferase LipB [Vampirovibrionales bacterium]
MTAGAAPALLSNTGLSVEDFGLGEYGEIHRRQLALVEARAEGRAGDTLLIGEHLPVITCGRAARPTDLLSPVFQTIPVERGGGVTLHAPGQLVAYPIRWLAPRERDLRQLLRALEQAVIETLAAYGVAGERREGFSGVWTRLDSGGVCKIAAVGVAVRRWVTYHGVAFNVNNALSDYAQIRPCGLEAISVTSLAGCLGAPPPLEGVKRLFTSTLLQQFQQAQASEETRLR